MLYDAAKTISLQAKLLCQGIDMRQQRIETSELHSKLFSIWTRYAAREFRTTTLLDQIFALYIENNNDITVADVDDEKDEAFIEHESDCE